VTFHRIPYATAKRRADIQEKMLSQLCGGLRRVEDLDWEKAEKLIQMQLTPLEFA
jgi:hypothetical protein